MLNHLLTAVCVGFTLATIPVLLALGACRAQDKPLSASSPETIQPSSSPQSSPEIEFSLSEVIRELPLTENIEKEKSAGMLRAWAHVPNHDHYREAWAADFEDPGMIRNYGEMAGAHGLAALIVDKTIAGAQRFSLVIFIERPAGRYDIYWIYRNMDLSKYRMDRDSGDILVEEVHDGKIGATCEIQWVSKEHRWTCKGL